MNKARQRATPEAMRKAIRIGAILVRQGFCTVEEIGEALELVRRGRFNAADTLVSSVVRRRLQK